MASIVQFVDSIAASPMVRLDLNSAASSLMIDEDGIGLSPAPVTYAFASTILADGATISGSSLENRTLSLPIKVVRTATADAVAVAIQNLGRELNRENNILKIQLEGVTSPVFFRTFRTGYSLSMLRMLLNENTGATVEIPAEPYGYGLKETLPSVVVNNDPAATVNGCYFDIDFTTPSNANPYFETDVTNWTPINGPTLTRSTAQFHQGVASMLITPNGVSADPRAQSETLVVTAGQSWFASGWLRSPGTPTVGITIRWYSDAAGSTLISESGTLAALTADTWSYSSVTAIAPATAIRARIAPRYSGTPAAGTTLFVDEAIIGPSQGIKGDAPTPLFLIVTAAGVTSSGRRNSVLSVRKRGTSSATPFVLQAEALTVGSDTSLLGPDAAMSGTGSDYARTTFATVPGMATRLSSAAGQQHPVTASIDARGRYRVFGRYRKSVAGDAISVRFNIENDGLISNGDTIVIPTGVDSAGPHYLDLGVYSIPMGPDPVTDGYSGVEIPARGLFIAYQAQRVSGTGNLDTDLFLFVPADDSAVLIKWSDVSGATDYIIDGRRNLVYARFSGGELKTHQIAEVVGRIPLIAPGTSNRVFFVRDVGLTTPSDDITGTTTITPYYWPRYLSVRPAAT